jgi:hypothetical protein
LANVLKQPNACNPICGGEPGQAWGKKQSTILLAGNDTIITLGEPEQLGRGGKHP